jgi:S1-C subfamily serine protease
MTADALYEMGSVQSHAGDWKGAAESFRRALAIYDKRVGAGHLRASYAPQQLALAIAHQNGWSTSASPLGAVVLRCPLPSCKDLEMGDWIQTLAGQKVENRWSFAEEVGKAPKGRPVVLGVQRAGKKIQVRLSAEGAQAIEVTD